ncbi:hypothetical protein ACO2Q8_23050 [Larkinella sp. VNQ87]|uniref:hypothetical protein n=1 Tax=Larkinella sp. VNQ87 TaxID=3400921 RepID=UPI003C026587
MIPFKLAVENAFYFIKELPGEPTDFLVEEVEMDDSKKYWFITISFLVKNDKLASSPLSALAKLNPEYERKYKTVKIDASNGEFVSMKIRELQQ